VSDQINLTQLREQAAYARDDERWTNGMAELPYQHLLALIDSAEAAIELEARTPFVTTREQKAALDCLRETLNRYNTT
jgi:hypothetical protein